MDVRSATSLPLVPAQLRELMKGVAVRSLFLDSTTDTLVRRFSETRRRHPLSQQRRPRPALDQHRAVVEPSSSSASCWPTCASRPTSSTAACMRPAQLQAT
jgi:UPF0042 nucleotide-binding protein